MTEVDVYLTSGELHVKQLEPHPTPWVLAHIFPEMKVEDAKAAVRVYCAVKGWRIRKGTYRHDWRTKGEI